MWLIDPKDGKKSISLTLMVISFISVVTLSFLQVFKKVDNGGMSLEIFTVCTGLYFGRRFSISTKNTNLSSNPDSDSQKE